MKRKIIKSKTCNTEHEFMTIFDVFEEGKRLFLNEFLYDGYLYIRENTDLSEISNDDILEVLKGNRTIVFLNDDLFDVIDNPSYYQQVQVKKIKDKYDSLLRFNDKFFEVEKEMDLNFFESVSPRKFKKDTVFSTGLIKAFMFEVPTDNFIIDNDRVLFIKEKDIKGFNPFI